MSSSEPTIRIGTVSYLNSVPLTEGLDGKPGVELCRGVPSALADDLVAGRIDVGLVPTIEVFRHPGFRIVPGISLACEGPVWTVALFCRVAPEQARTVALDVSSRTSAALTRIAYREVFHTDPEFVPTLPVADVRSIDADAVLLIGDPVFRQNAPDFRIVDLGELWNRWTGLPFVFAVWAARTDAPHARVIGLLNQAKREGMAHLSQIAARECVARRLDPALCRAYLSERMRYDLTPRHLEGMRRFLRLASDVGILSEPDDPSDLLLPV